MNTHASYTLLLQRAKVDTSEDKKSSAAPVETAKSAPVAAPKAVKGIHLFIHIVRMNRLRLIHDPSS